MFTVYITAVLACFLGANAGEEAQASPPPIQRGIVFRPLSSEGSQTGDLQTDKSADLELYLGIRHDELFERTNLIASRRGVSSRGVSYNVESADNSAEFKVGSFSLSVNSSVSDAVDLLSDIRHGFAVGPSGYYEENGSNFIFWRTEGSEFGSVLIRDRNVVLSVSWRGNGDEVEARLRKFFEIIRTDSDIAPRGSFSRTARIEGIRRLILPQVILEVDEATGEQFISPKIYGLGDPRKWHINAGPRPLQEDPVHFSARDRSISWEGMTTGNIDLFVATDENLFLRQEIIIVDE